MSYSPKYVVPLPPRHSFPMRKFSALRDQLLRDEIVAPADIVEPAPASWDTLALVHSREYLNALRTGTMTRRAVRRMGLPWTESLVRRSRIAVTGTINACRFALEDGVGGNLAGGTHHAMPERPEGFCVLNDVAIAMKVLLAQGAIRSALIIDLDVHQGNGTALCLHDEPRAYTFSAHGEKNFPLNKEVSDRDVGLDDKLGDDEYLEIIEHELESLFDRAAQQAGAPLDLVVYLGGVDVLADDKFGRLALTRDGLERRDRLVISRVRDLGVPLCLLLSGGYSPTPEETAQNHAIMYRVASEVYAGVGA